MSLSRAGLYEKCVLKPLPSRLAAGIEKRFRESHKSATARTEETDSRWDEEEKEHSTKGFHIQEVRELPGFAIVTRLRNCM